LQTSGVVDPDRRVPGVVAGEAGGETGQVGVTQLDAHVVEGVEVVGIVVLEQRRLGDGPGLVDFASQVQVLGLEGGIAGPPRNVVAAGTAVPEIDVVEGHAVG